MKTVEVTVYNSSYNKLPKYETPQSAGMDVRADFSKITPSNLLKVYGDAEFIFEAGPEDVEHDHPAMLKLAPGARALVPTGLYMALPEGYEAQIRPRSGLALKSGITVLNSPGTIDSDYRGELGIIIINQGLESVWIEDGERICQMVINEVVQGEWKTVESKDELSNTDRKGGFGHTGVK